MGESNIQLQAQNNKSNGVIPREIYYLDVTMYTYTVHNGITGFQHCSAVAMHCQ